VSAGNAEMKRMRQRIKNFIIEFGTYGQAIFSDQKQKKFSKKDFTGKSEPDSIRVGSPKYIRMAELVHELNFFEHVRPVCRQLIHFEHHHLTRHFVSNLKKNEQVN
jgi:hypothetical protein